MLYGFASRLAQMEGAKGERGFTLTELLVVITFPFRKRHYLRPPAQLTSTVSSFRTAAWRRSSLYHW